jgi:hypothetical protein
MSTATLEVPQTTKLRPSLADDVRDLGGQPLSHRAVQAYMREKVNQVIRESGWGGLFLSRNPKLYFWLDSYGLAIFIAGVALSVAAVTFLALGVGRDLYSSPLVLGAFMLIFGPAKWYSHKLAFNGAIKTEWLSTRYYVGDEFVLDGKGNRIVLPLSARELAFDLKERRPGVGFLVFFLKEDPVLAAEEKEEMENIYGWDQDKRLLEIDGRIHEFPPLS